MQKHFRIRELSPTWLYRVDEAARVVGACPRTIRNAIKSGKLAVFDRQKPIGILGSDLKDWIVGRRHEMAVKLGPVEFFCFGCKAARRPHAGCVWLTDTNRPSPLMSGVCERCGARINRAIKADELSTWLRHYEVKKHQKQSTT